MAADKIKTDSDKTKVIVKKGDLAGASIRGTYITKSSKPMVINLLARESIFLAKL
jgi:hypothetical protein